MHCIKNDPTCPYKTTEHPVHFQCTLNYCQRSLDEINKNLMVMLTGLMAVIKNVPGSKVETIGGPPISDTSNLNPISDSSEKDPVGIRRTGRPRKNGDR